MFDINGDARPDSIYIRKQLHVRLNTGSGFEAEQIYDLEDIGIADMGKAEYEIDTTTVTGHNTFAGVGVPVGSTAAGYTHAQTDKSMQNKVYHGFMDVDGDGMVDIIKAKEDFYYKNTGYMNGRPHFEKTRLRVDTVIPQYDVI